MRNLHEYRLIYTELGGHFGTFHRALFRHGFAMLTLILKGYRNIPLGYLVIKMMAVAATVTIMVITVIMKG